MLSKRLQHHWLPSSIRSRHPEKIKMKSRNPDEIKCLPLNLKIDQINVKKWALDSSSILLGSECWGTHPQITSPWSVAAVPWIAVRSLETSDAGAIWADSNPRQLGRSTPSCESDHEPQESRSVLDITAALEGRTISRCEVSLDVYIISFLVGNSVSGLIQVRLDTLHLKIYTALTPSTASIHRFEHLPHLILHNLSTSFQHCCD